MRRLIISALIAWMFCNLMLPDSFGHAKKAYSTRVEILLEQLDTVLANNNIYTDRLEAEIYKAKAARNNGSLSEEQEYGINSRLYDLLYVFSADSAMVYANENLEIATRNHRADRIAEWKINCSFLLSASGLLKESYDMFSGISIAGADRQLKLKYYTQGAYLYSHMAQYIDVEANTGRKAYYHTKEAEYIDSLNILCRPEDDLYLWYRGWKYQDDHNLREKIIRDLKSLLEGSSYNSRIDAMNAYILAKLSKKEGNTDDYLAWLIYSGMADIRCSNHDIASLEELAKELFPMGDLDRAYSYTVLCQRNALDYKNRVRVISLADMQNEIWHAYRQRNMRQEIKQRVYTCLLGLLSIVLTCAVIYIVRQMKSLALSRSRLKDANDLQKAHMAELEKSRSIQEEANGKLKELNAKLKDVNNSLQEANYIKEEYISQIFTFCSEYISKLNDYRKVINWKAKAGQYSKVIQLTDSESMVQDELKAFYHNFDIVFLRLYPNFIDDFNSLLKPEARFHIEAGEGLNTQLRIYALVRLGINDSVKIAEFLHCSVQTVYNYRLRIRNNAVIPKDKFAETVARLGKVQF